MKDLQFWWTIYFAWKIWHTDWRHSILPLRNNTWGDIIDFEWFSYIWPHFIWCDHWCYHWNTTHWNWLDNNTCSGNETNRLDVFNKCLNAIDFCDVVFAWIDDLSAYWTFVELWYAYSKWKMILIAYKEWLDVKELWFTTCLANHSIVSETAKEWRDKLKNFIL